MKLPALMYHDIVAPGASDASGFPGAAAAHYKLDAEAFSRHLVALAEGGIHAVVVTDAPISHASSCLLTFDDGGASAVATAAALAGHHMRGHFFITTDRIGQPGFVSADDLTALRAAGHVVGSHSHTHPTEISRLADAQIEAEWRQSLDCLGHLLGEPVTVASVPGGFYSQRLARIASAAGIRYLFTSEPTVRSHRVDNCLVLGRYTLWRGMGPPCALALAKGTHAWRQRQWLAWNLKKPLKQFARPLYRLVRHRWLGQA